MPTSLREPRSLKDLAKFPSDSGSEVFVGDLTVALAALGVSELWLHDELARRVHLALGIIHRHARAKANRFHDHGAKDEAAAYRRIQFAVQPSQITGSFGQFWSYMARNFVTYCTDGRYLMPYPRTFAQARLETEFEWQYRRLLCACALLIQSRLSGWEGATS